MMEREDMGYPLEKPRQQTFMGTSGLTVFEAELRGQRNMNWLELFSGFRQLRAVVYSSGLDFLLSVLDLFEDVEIIFGSEHTLNQAHWDALQVSQVLEGSLGEELAIQRALQEILQERLQKAPKLVDRIARQSLRFRLATGRPSHEKLYLLAHPETHRYRVIVGSANLSRSAFEGHQRELIVVFDDKKAYDAFLDYYNHIESRISAPIEISSLKQDLSPWEKIPIMKASLVVIAKPSSSEFSREVLHRALELQKETTQAPLPRTHAERPVRIEPDRLIQAFRTMQAVSIELQSPPPRVRVDWEAGQVFVGENLWWDIRESPRVQDIRRDIQLLLEFFKGFQRFFRGMVEETLRRYWAFWVWLYAAPAVAFLRQAMLARHHDPWLYPLFAILYGRSSGGKTTLSRVLVRSMFGQEYILKSQDFTRTQAEGLMRMVGVLPIIAEDVASQRFNQHVPELIRNDFQTAPECAPLIIATNRDVETITQDISKRALTIYVGISIAEGQAGRSTIPRRTLEHIGTAFYRTYLERWCPIVLSMRDAIEKGEDPPDLFEASSKLLRELLMEFTGCIPEWAHPLDYPRIFSLRHRRFMEELERFLEQHPDDVQIDYGRKEIVLHFMGDHVQARQFARLVPDFVLKSKTVDKVVLDLEALEEELGFHPVSTSPRMTSLLDRLRKILQRTSLK